MEAREGFQRGVTGVIAAHSLDAICFPDVKIAAPTLQDVLASRWTCLEFPTNTVIASQLWMPAITVPAGFTGDGATGRPGTRRPALPRSRPARCRIRHRTSQPSSTFTCTDVRPLDCKAGRARSARAAAVFGAENVVMLDTCLGRISDG